LLFLPSFLVGTTIVLGATASLSLFVTTWDAQRLPYVYLVAPLLLGAAGAGLAMLERRVSLGALLTTTLALLAVRGLLLRFGFVRSALA
jgi:hypothetical protein